MNHDIPKTILVPVTITRKDMGSTKKPAAEYLSELEKAGLLERKSQGLGLRN